MTDDVFSHYEDDVPVFITKAEADKIKAEKSAVRNYRATSLTFTAVKFEGTAESAAEIRKFSGFGGYFDKIDNSLSAGNTKLMPGDYLLKADDVGGFFACSGDVFPRNFTEI